MRRKKLTEAKEKGGRNAAGNQQRLQAVGEWSTGRRSKKVKAEGELGRKSKREKRNKRERDPNFLSEERENIVWEIWVGIYKHIFLWA